MSVFTNVTDQYLVTGLRSTTSVTQRDIELNKTSLASQSRVRSSLSHKWNCPTKQYVLSSIPTIRKKIKYYLGRVPNTCRTPLCCLYLTEAHWPSMHGTAMSLPIAWRRPSQHWPIFSSGTRQAPSQEWYRDDSPLSDCPFTNDPSCAAFQPELFASSRRASLAHKGYLTVL
jgi:hypothetical protein